MPCTRRPIGHRWFTDGETRPVFVGDIGRQFVEDDDGERVYGVWLPVDLLCLLRGGEDRHEAAEPARWQRMHGGRHERVAGNQRPDGEAR